jgi:hypothetical protein
LLMSSLKCCYFLSRCAHRNAASSANYQQL